MARIAGVDLPNNKRVEYALTYIYGIGVSKSNEILAATGINPDTRAKDLTDDDIAKLREYIDHNVTCLLYTSLLLSQLPASSMREPTAETPLPQSRLVLTSPRWLSKRA